MRRSSPSLMSVVRIGAPVVALALGAARGQDDVPFTDAERARILQLSPLGPPPADPTNRFADDPAAAHLGRFLFFDQRLSGNGNVSCATCHDPNGAFTDGRALAEGVATGVRNAPTLLNVAYQRWLFWDGRVDALWLQALQPLERDFEMNGDRHVIAQLMVDDPDLRAAYESVFGEEPNDGDDEAVNRVFVHVGKAIEGYERRLVGGRSAFDDFAARLVRGDGRATDGFSSSARRGLRLFVGKAGCRLCHHDPLLSDGEFHNIGVPPNPAVPRHDAGRYEGVRLLAANPFRHDPSFNDADPVQPAATVRTGPELWGQFRTPTLRNVAVTGPYMHQGQFETLRDVLHFYSTREGAVTAGHHQEQILAPLNLSEAEIDDLIAFLETLTDPPLDPELLVAPSSPIFRRKTQ